MWEYQPSDHKQDLKKQDDGSVISDTLIWSPAVTDSDMQQWQS